MVSRSIRRIISALSRHAKAAQLGLSRADSVPNLTRRVEAQPSKDPRLAGELDQILRPLAAGAALPDRS